MNWIEMDEKHNEKIYDEAMEKERQRLESLSIADLFRKYHNFDPEPKDEEEYASFRNDLIDGFMKQHGDWLYEDYLQVKQGFVSQIEIQQ